MNALVFNCSPVKNGATAAIAQRIADDLSPHFTVRTVSIGDYSFSFCRGCRSCHTTARCVISDDIPIVIDELAAADVIVFVSPSYWADIPGQFKAFIDRCTPWCDTHEPHASIPEGKKGYTAALRTGGSRRECDRIISSVEHFCGHLHIAPSGSIALCSVENKSDVPGRYEEIDGFCKKIINDTLRSDDL
ncbi:MAG: flavodoxin family protein [Ruminococcus sp.]|nr:flavodoxin family protein [Ruminococcus sp.]